MCVLGIDFLPQFRKNFDGVVFKFFFYTFIIIFMSKIYSF